MYAQKAHPGSRFGVVKDGDKYVNALLRPPNQSAHTSLSLSLDLMPKREDFLRKNVVASRQRGMWLRPESREKEREKPEE